MDKLSLKVSKRDAFGKKTQPLVENGHVLGNIYGKGMESIAVQGDYRDVNKAIEHAGYNHPIELEVEGDGNHLVLVDGIERNNVTQKLHHVTFHAIKKGEKVSADIPIRLVGDAPAERTGKIVVTLLDAVEVEAIPSKLPEIFEVSIEGLEDVNDSITIGDIKHDDDVVLHREPEEVIAKVDLPRAEEEPEAEEAGPEDAEEVPSEHGGEESEEAKGESSE